MISWPQFSIIFAKLFPIYSHLLNIKGSLEDWIKLKDKTENLQKMLDPIMSEIGLKKWFGTTLNMLAKLIETFKGGPDKEWWGHILSWNILHGSGGRVNTAVQWNITYRALFSTGAMGALAPVVFSNAFIRIVS